MTTTLRTIGLLAVMATAVSAQLGRTGPPSAANPLARDQSAVAAGRERFQQLCTGCHGRSGEGGRGEGQGPNLVNSWEVRRAADAELMSYIRNGVKGTAMPAFSLPADQIRQLVAFVRSLNAPADSIPVSGDPAKGEALFYGKAGCGSCHMIRGHGGYLGPDLSNAGAAHRLGELHNAILNPQSLSPEGYWPVLLAGGLRGIVKHKSEWSMQIIDEKGQIHLLDRAGMNTAKIQPGSWMPANYGQRLSPAEIDDLVAFLARQSVRRPNETSQRAARPVQEQPN